MCIQRGNKEVGMRRRSTYDKVAWLAMRSRHLLKTWKTSCMHYGQLPSIDGIKFA